MRQVIGIRTHRWGEEEERLLAQLKGAFPGDIAVVFHNRPDGLSVPLDVVDIDGTWVDANGLRAIPDWAWRCGDYFYYALRAAKPDYDFYWLVEPDVYFSSDPTDFFARFSALTTDALGSDIKPYVADIPFTRALGGLKPYQAIFPLTRFSGRALDDLFARRQAYSRTDAGKRTFANDEIFCFSNMVASEVHVTDSFESHTPDWFSNRLFATNPTLMLDAVRKDVGPKQICHPVRSRAAFLSAVAVRLAANDGFLRKMRSSLSQLTDAEVTEIVTTSASLLRKSLEEYRVPGVLVRRSRRK